MAEFVHTREVSFSDLRPGFVVDGKYEIIGPIGSGGMGTVYKARHLKLEALRCIKVMKRALLDDEESRARFLREARAATSVQHPNVAAVYDFGELDDGCYYMISEFIEGHTVSESIDRQGRFDPGTAIFIAREVLSGLSEIHARDLVHRDISGHNVMILRREDRLAVKIIDLGLAKFVGVAGALKAGTIVTEAGEILGNPKYASPEQLGRLVRGEEIDGRSDVYSLGILLYRMLTGVLPFDATTFQEYVAQHLSARPLPFRFAAPDLDLSERLEAVVMKAIEKDRDQRFGSAAEFDDALARFDGEGNPIDEAELSPVVQEIRVSGGPSSTELREANPWRGSSFSPRVSPGKLGAPSLNDWTIVVDRLQPQFHEGLNRPLTFINAGAGFGKTTSTAKFLRDRGTRHVWLTLDPLDQDEHRVLEYLIEGFRRLTGTPLWESAFHAPDLSPKALAELFIRDLDAGPKEPVVLILDEFDHINDAETRSNIFLSNLIAFQPGFVQVWILSRNAPVIGVPRAAERARWMGEDLFMWGAPEVQALSRGMGHELSEGDAARIADLAGGRPGTIQLIARKLGNRNGNHEVIAGVLAHPTVELRRYIEERILADLEPSRRHLLMKLALVEEIDGESLAEALSDADVSGEIDQITEETSLLRAGSRPATYRMDPIVRSVLLRLARSELGATGIAEIRARLGEIYLAKGWPEKAIPILVEAGQATKGAEALVRKGEELLRKSHTSVLRELCQLIPPRTAREYPALDHFVARTHLIEGNYAEAAERYDAILAAEISPDLRAWALQGLCEAAYRRNLMDEARALALRLEEVLDSADPHCTVKILNDFAIIKLRSGWYEEAKSLWEDALAKSYDPAVPKDLRSAILHNLGLPNAAMGRVEAAKGYFMRIMSVDEEPRKAQEAMAGLNLARLAIMQGDLGSAERWLGVASRASEKFGLESFVGEVLEVYSLLHRKRGELDRAREVLDRASEIYAAAAVDTAMREFIDEEANVELECGNMETAWSLASSLIRRRRETGNEVALATPLITLAKIEAARDHPDGAVDALREAVDIARRRSLGFQLAEALLWLGSFTGDTAATAEARALIQGEGYHLDEPSPRRANETIQ